MIRTSFKIFIFIWAFIALPASLRAEGLKGDPAAGEKKNAMCIGCHGIAGYKASFPEVYRVPKIAQQGGKYIEAALQAYKSGNRHHMTMRSVALGLSDQDIADLAAFYEQQGRKVSLPEQAPAAPAVVAELLNKGGCIGCHGANFSKPIDPSYPKLAGQNPDYLLVALKSYQSQGHSTWGRVNPIMPNIVKPYSSAELKLIANYIGNLPGELQVVPQSKFR